MLSTEVVLGAKTHANQMVDIICSVLIAGRYAELDEAYFVSVADGKGAGVGVECEQCRAKRRAEHRNFSCGNVYFHMIFGFPKGGSRLCANLQAISRKWL